MTGGEETAEGSLAAGDRDNCEEPVAGAAKILGPKVNKRAAKMNRG